jgi:hypothetical protein
LTGFDNYQNNHKPITKNEKSTFTGYTSVSLLHHVHDGLHELFIHERSNERRVDNGYLFRQLSRPVWRIVSLASAGLAGKFMGKIPQVAHTYNVVGNMNEHQLAIAETTFGGRKELESQTGAIIDYGSAIYITLQRAKNAREAIVVMTDLIEKYGWASSGESISIIDPNEVWIIEIIGKGEGDYKIINYEMESAAIAGLAALMGHQATTICLIIANRANGDASADYKPHMKKLVEYTLNSLIR